MLCYVMLIHIKRFNVHFVRVSVTMLVGSIKVQVHKLQ